MTLDEETKDLIWRTSVVLALVFWLSLMVSCMSIQPGQTYRWGTTEGCWPHLLNKTYHYQAL